MHPNGMLTINNKVEEKYSNRADIIRIYTLDAFQAKILIVIIN